jgi:hypothetical protein
MVEHENEHDRVVAREPTWEVFYETIPNDDEYEEIKGDRKGWFYPEVTDEDGEVPSNLQGLYRRFLFDDEELSFADSDSVGEALPWAYAFALNWEWNQNNEGHPEDSWKLAATVEKAINGYTDASAHIWPLEFHDSLEGGFYDESELLERDEDNSMGKMLAYDTENDETFLLNFPQTRMATEQNEYFEEEFDIDGHRFYEFAQIKMPKLENSVFVRERLYSDVVAEKVGTPTPAHTPAGREPGEGPPHLRAGDDTFGAGTEGDTAIDNYHPPFAYEGGDTPWYMDHREFTILNDRMFRQMVRSPETVPPEDERDGDRDWDELSRFGEDAYATMGRDLRLGLSQGFTRPEFRKETDGVGFMDFFRYGVALHNMAEHDDAWALYLDDDQTMLARFDDAATIDEIRDDTSDYNLADKYDPVETVAVEELGMPWFDDGDEQDATGTESAGLGTAVGFGLAGAAAGAALGLVGDDSSEGVVDPAEERVSLDDGPVEPEEGTLEGLKSLLR